MARMSWVIAQAACHYAPTLMSRNLQASKVMRGSLWRCSSGQADLGSTPSRSLVWVRLKCSGRPLNEQASSDTNQGFPLGLLLKLSCGGGIWPAQYLSAVACQLDATHAAVILPRKGSIALASIASHGRASSQVGALSVSARWRLLVRRLAPLPAEGACTGPVALGTAPATRILRS